MSGFTTPGFARVGALAVLLLLGATASAAVAQSSPNALRFAEGSESADRTALSAQPSVLRPEPEARLRLSLGERALDLVYFLAGEIGSRPAGSETERRAAAFLVDEFTAMGYAVEVTPFLFSSRIGAGNSQNVVARDPDEDPRTPLVIVGAHYDSVAAGPGANDNASGTATVVELARELAQDPIPGVAVWYVAFGAEEVGLFGSQHLAGSLSAADRRRLQVALSIDMMAVGDQPAFHGSQPWLSHALARAASQGWDPAVLPANFRRLSDHGPFLEAGLPALMLHWLDDPCWHQACDVPERVQYPALELMGAIAIELIRIAAG